MTEVDALLLSLVIEVPIACAIGATVGVTDRRRLGTVAVLATCFTHAFVWLLGTTWPRVIALELAVIPVECACYAWAAGLKPRHALLISVAANATSFAVGLLLFAVLRRL